MTIEPNQYLVFISVITLIVVTPGPNLALLLATAPGSSKMTGFAMVTGFCAAIISHATLALLGVGAVIAASAMLFTLMKAVGAAYLIWIGVKSLLSLRPVRDAIVQSRGQAVPMTARRAFAGGYLSNFLNPKPAIFYVAAFPQFLAGHQQDMLVNGAALALTHALIALSFYGMVVLLIDRVTLYLTLPHIARKIKAASGAALILLGGRLLLAKSPT